MIDVLFLTAPIYFLLSLCRDLLFPETLTREDNNPVSDPSDTKKESAS